MNIERRTIEDLILLHELEPALREIYVEGASDQAFFEWYLHEQKCTDVPVYEITTIEVPSSFILENQLEDNNRGRVIALALLLDRAVSDHTSVTCIADADFDYLLSITWDCRTLLMTDYASLELYAFNERSVSKVLKLNASGFPRSAAEVLAAISPVLQEMFLVRLGLKLAGVGEAALKPNKCCDLDQGTLKFDGEKFVRHSAREDRKCVEEVTSVMDEYRKLLTADVRKQINGHDFLGLVTWYIRNHAGFGRLKPEEITVGLVHAAATPENLDNESLFLSLRRRLRVT